MSKNPDYRPNSSRAVFIIGVVDQDASEKVTRETLRLSSTPEPLSVFIDSPGGSTYFAESIFRMLRVPDQDSAEKRRVITVGLNMTASAACDLLIAGDYALVYPHTTLLCHGVRRSGEGLEVTRESAIDIAKNLATSNEQYALELANNAISRFIFRFAACRSLFDEIRKQPGQGDKSDIECFLEVIALHISQDLQVLLRNSYLDTLKTDNIDLRMNGKLHQLGEMPASPIEFEAMILHCIIEHDIDLAKLNPGWSFRTEGIQEFESKFSALLSSHGETHRKQIEKLVVRWGEFLLSEQEQQQYGGIEESEREAWLSETVTPLLRSLWFFFIALARRLQQKDNYLTAEEAYWIGLVDEIIGRTDLPNPRIIVELAEDIYPQSSQT